MVVSSGSRVGSAWRRRVVDGWSCLPGLGGGGAAMRPATGVGRRGACAGAGGLAAI